MKTQHTSSLYPASTRCTVILFIALALGTILLPACSGSGHKKADTVGEVVELPHADNDIAMTLRSIMDAMNVNQPLDSSEYNFQGILTDGQGMPLYTDIQGAPGQWSVEVLSPTKARVKNLYLGDLIPEELTQYLLQSLDIPDSLMVKEGSPINMPDAEIAIYDFGAGQLIFETLTAKTEDGHSGPLLNILLLKKANIDIPT